MKQNNNQQGLDRVSITLGKYDVLFEKLTDNDVDISVYENLIYYKRSLSKEEAVSVINILTKCYLSQD